MQSCQLSASGAPARKFKSLPYRCPSRTYRSSASVHAVQRNDDAAATCSAITTPPHDSSTSHGSSFTAYNKTLLGKGLEVCSSRGGGQSGGNGSGNGRNSSSGGGSGAGGDAEIHYVYLLSVSVGLAALAVASLINVVSSTKSLSSASLAGAAQQQHGQKSTERATRSVGGPAVSDDPDPSEHQQQHNQHNQRQAESKSGAAAAESAPAASAAEDPLDQAAAATVTSEDPSDQVAAAAAAAPKRIVFFIEPSPFTYMSGYQTRFLATIKELTAAGCEVLVVTPGRGAAGVLPGGQAQPSKFAGASIIEAGSFPCPGYGSVPLSLGLSPRIFNAVKNWKPDLIHVTSPGALPVAAWLYSRMLRVPLVASYHTHVPSYLPRLGLDWLAGGMWGLIRAIHRSAHLTIAVSPKTATDLVVAGACDHRAIKVWPKAVDCELFNPARASSEMRDRLAGSLAPYKPLDGISSSNDGSKEPLLLYVGRVSPEKNVTLLKTVLQKLPGARLAIVGDGPALEDMKAHFKGTQTTFLGALKGKELAAAYASADVFVMPSETETLGNVVGEAMASGLPVVAAAAGGVPSFISKPGQTGMLFPPGDATNAAAQIEELLADPGARRSMSIAARADMERCSWRHATLEILQKHYPAAVTANKEELQRHDEWLDSMLLA